MEAAYFKRQLAINRDRIAALARGVPEEQARWKPDPESWSILEVVNHLADEEELDFPARLKIIMEKSEKSWTPIDPEAWVIEGQYNEKDLYESLTRYMTLRNANLEWLDSVENPDWDMVYEAPFGEIKAGDMFVSWVIHDLIHLRQLADLQLLYLEDKAKPFRLDYAGDLGVPEEESVKIETD
ncbi:MAG: DinB family protein [Anaerolineales bacterium]|nr:DinB family protein [Anaerolineales bacterium]